MLLDATISNFLIKTSINISGYFSTILQDPLLDVHLYRLRNLFSWTRGWQKLESSTWFGMEIFAFKSAALAVVKRV
jgi:hypothetical protein